MHIEANGFEFYQVNEVKFYEKGFITLVINDQLGDNSYITPVISYWDGSTQTPLNNNVKSIDELNKMIMEYQILHKGNPDSIQLLNISKISL